ncbi:MAG: J domain-containing protein [Myxococcales bacterium]|nr:MAG: J domain-containing protein [Myxococcales bacterium]
MARIIQDDTVLFLNSEVKLEDLDLTAQEGFILSRITRKTAVREVYQLSLLDRAATASVLKKLVDQGVLGIDEPEKEEPVAAAVPLPKRDYGGFIFNLLELQEEIDLPQDLKKEILFVHTQMDEWTNYELLGLTPDAGEAAVRTAFLQLSKIFHPDVYFRKRLGSYQTRINQIYSHLAAAHATLTDPVECVQYRRRLIDEGKILPGPNDLPEDPMERERRLQRQAKEQRILNNPMLKRVQKGREFFEAGEADIQKQAWISAANNFKFAIMYDPHNELYKHKAEQVKDLADRAAAERVYQRGLVLESYGQDGYFEMFIKAATMYPNGAEFNVKVARSYCDQTDYREALPFAKRAVAVEPKNNEYRLLLGQILLKLKDKAEAAKQFEAVIKAEPENELAKNLLKEAKKWF